MRSHFVKDLSKRATARAKMRNESSSRKPGWGTNEHSPVAVNLVPRLYVSVDGMKGVGQDGQLTASLSREYGNRRWEQSRQTVLRGAITS